MNFPEMAVFHQRLVSLPVKDAVDKTRTVLEKLMKNRPQIAGKSVAVAVGSRGIDQLDTVVFEVIQFLKNQGAKPFIVPAMGSHGGAGPEGQERLLASLGISAKSAGVPVQADMDTRLAGETAEGLRLYISASALDADLIVPVNRIKPHTKFFADIESGLCKMLAVGLGKERGAAECHRFAVGHSFGWIESAARVLLERLNVVFGIALIEDGRGRLSEIHALPPESFVDEEKKLLRRAYAMMGRIPFEKIDVLVVDGIGKEISGIGMDSNVVGRHRDIAGDFHTSPDPRRIFVRELSEKSGGNANGIGLADVTTSRLVSGIDAEKTAVNAVTAISPEKAAIPVHFETDRRCLRVCIHTAGLEKGEDAGIVRIRDTASLEFMEISRPLEKEIGPDAGLERITPWRTWEFDKSGNLFSFYPED